MEQSCSFQGCDRKQRRNGYCDTHSNQLRRFGKLQAIRPAAKTWDAYVARFWSRVEKMPGDEGCWLYTGYRNELGYGRLNAFRDKGLILAHRLSWRLSTGDAPPSDLLVCHHCDNPPCVRPEHLFLGTDQDNSTDCQLKERHSKGSNQHFARLTEDLVRDIRIAHADGTSIADLARRCGVDPSTVSCAVARKTWKHVA